MDERARMPRQLTPSPWALGSNGQQLDLGLRRYSREDLEAVRAAKETLHIQVLGLAIIAEDVSPELARDTIASIHVLGALQAPAAVKAALKDRIQ
jgi:hypothetical protein